MTREVWLVSAANRPKAEEALKKDDLVSRQSIFVRSTESIGMVEEEGFFVIIDGSDHALKKADELLKGIAKKYEGRDEVLERFDDIEASTSESFGFIMGG